jgi:hypothetical protein
MITHLLPPEIVCTSTTPASSKGIR